MAVFEIVAKMINGKFKKNIFFKRLKAYICLTVKIDKLNRDESRVY